MSDTQPTEAEKKLALDIVVEVSQANWELTGATLGVEPRLLADVVAPILAAHRADDSSELAEWKRRVRMVQDDDRSFYQPQIDELAKALEPFASIVQRSDFENDPIYLPDDCYYNATIPAGWFRQARAAIALYNAGKG